MTHLILLRHGQSVWNKKNLFTGWVDIPLSSEGIEEAYQAGREIQNIPIDCIYTSTLMRSIMTATLALSVHHSGKIPQLIHEEVSEKQAWYTCYSTHSEKELIPMRTAWQLNERMYGELQGCDKDEARRAFGKEQVHIWRRSFATPPPRGESLQMTASRTWPYFESVIAPEIKQGKNVLISAHGNSLRSIVMQLDSLSEEEVLHLEIPTGKALIYFYEKGQFKKATL